MSTNPHIRPPPRGFDTGRVWGDFMKNIFYVTDFKFLYFRNEEEKFGESLYGYPKSEPYLKKYETQNWAKAISLCGIEDKSYRTNRDGFVENFESNGSCKIRIYRLGEIHIWMKGSQAEASPQCVFREGHITWGFVDPCCPAAQIFRKRIEIDKLRGELKALLKTFEKSSNTPLIDQIEVSFE